MFGNTIGSIGVSLLTSHSRSPSAFHSIRYEIATTNFFIVLMLYCQYSSWLVVSFTTNLYGRGRSLVWPSGAPSAPGDSASGSGSMDSLLLPDPSGPMSLQVQVPLKPSKTNGNLIRLMPRLFQTSSIATRLLLGCRLPQAGLPFCPPRTNKALSEYLVNLPHQFKFPLGLRWCKFCPVRHFV